MKKLVLDLSSMQVNISDVEWAHRLVFNQGAMSFVERDSKGTYNQYFPPVQKKLNEKIAVINFLKLKESKPLKMLDIGTGAGHLVAMVNELGHNCTGTEIPESVKELSTLYSHYNISVSELFVEKQKHIELPAKYNIITSLRTVFDYDGPWTAADWNFFKENIFEYLEPNGILFIKTNIKPVPGAGVEIEKAFGKRLNGWNSFTYQITKN